VKIPAAVVVCFTILDRSIMGMRVGWIINQITTYQQKILLIFLEETITITMM
jgi:hypothetical protein